MILIILVLIVAPVSVQLTENDVRQQFYSMPKTADMRNLFQNDANYYNGKANILDNLESLLAKQKIHMQK